MKGIMFIEELFHATVEERKTVTRRLATNDKHLDFVVMNGNEALFHNLQTGEQVAIKSRYKVGEVVYLKEPYDLFKGCVYYKYDLKELSSTWKNKMFMGEDKARYFIEIVSVSLEPLHEISEEQIIKEGLQELLQSRAQLAVNGRLFRDYSKKKDFFNDGVKAVKSYETLWNKINKDIPFSDNPYVWVYEYKLLNRLVK